MGSMKAELSREILELTFLGCGKGPDFNKSAVFRGLKIESVRVSQAEEYSFKWEGAAHYLALHDIVMAEGELSVAGGPAEPGSDIRGTMTYLPPTAPVQGWSRTVDRQNLFTAVFFDPSLLAEELGKHFSKVENAPLIYFENRALEQTLQKIQELVINDDHQNSIYAETLGLAAALELSRLQKAYSFNLLPRSGGLSRLQEHLLRDFVAENFSKKTSLDELAALVNLSRFHFARAFKVTFGMPPHQYVTERKLEAGKALLTTTKHSISEIASAVGFNTQDQFIRAFNLAVNMTPGQFRRKSI
jgi:AraC family transcriptional regulator